MPRTTNPDDRHSHRRPLTGVVLAFVVAVVAVLSMGGQVSAQQAQAAPAAQAAQAAPAPQSWSITPAGGSPDQPGNRPDLSFTVDPGSMIADTVQVWNYGAEPIELQVYVADAIISAEGSYDLRLASDQPVDVASWTTLSANKVVVPASSVVAVAVNIKVPKDALPGDHPGGIVASVVTPAENAEDTQVLVEKRVGTRLNVRVTGDYAPSSAVRDVKATYNGSLNPVASGSLTVDYTIANTGNTKLGGRVHLDVRGPFGSITQVDLPDVPVTLPGDGLHQVANVDGVWPVGPITAKVTFTPFDDPGLPGVSQTAAASGSASTFAFPLGQLLVLLVLAVLIVAAVMLQRHRRNVPAAAPTSNDGGTTDDGGNSTVG
jgi:hypothetical protein